MKKSLAVASKGDVVKGTDEPAPSGLACYGDFFKKNGTS